MANDQRLDCQDFYNHLHQAGIDYFCGVPDSLVSSFSFFLAANAGDKHMITANEGNAIGVAIGYHVATGKVPLVYMQNSGLSNAVDPLASLVDPTVLGVPMILLVSWRGQPGVKDEPQHVKQGAITTELLDSLCIPYQVLSKDSLKAKSQIEKAVQITSASNRPAALILEKDTFLEYGPKLETQKYALGREEAIEIIMDCLGKSDVIVAGIGKTSREVFERRNATSQPHDKDLLIVGGMGHASSIALGIAKQKPDRNVYCLDGDGAVLMHMGSLANIGIQAGPNFRHIVLNNGLHDSVGGQHTVGLEVNLPAIAKSCGYKKVMTISSSGETKQALAHLGDAEGPVFIEIKVHRGARSNLTRPSIHPSENKKSFMAHLDDK